MRFSGNYESEWFSSYYKQLYYGNNNTTANYIALLQNLVDRYDVIVLITKILTTPFYQRVIATFDEMQINGIIKHAVIHALPKENAFAGKASFYPQVIMNNRQEHSNVNIKRQSFPLAVCVKLLL